MTETTSYNPPEARHPADDRAVIRGFEVEMQPLDDGRRQCWVSRGICCSSLAHLMDLGTIVNEECCEFYAPAPVIVEEIVEWALARGY